MAIYTGVADANGDFMIPFSSSYTSGQKVTVTAEKEGALKTIELFAPSDAIGGGSIQFSGNLIDFPNNVGVVTITGIEGKIQDFGLASTDTPQIGFAGTATGLVLGEGVTQLGVAACQAWKMAESLQLPGTMQLIGPNAFSTWVKLKSLDIPKNVAIIDGYAFYSLTNCNEIIVRATTPPSIQNTTFQLLKSTCVFKVPAASVAAYQAAANWSTFASRIQAI